MRFVSILAIAVAILALILFPMFASAQCVNGVCYGQQVQAVYAAPVQFQAVQYVQPVRVQAVQQVHYAQPVVQQIQVQKAVAVKQVQAVHAQPVVVQQVQQPQQIIQQQTISKGLFGRVKSVKSTTIINP